MSEQIEPWERMARNASGCADTVLVLEDAISSQTSEGSNLVLILVLHSQSPSVCFMPRPNPMLSQQVVTI